MNTLVNFTKRLEGKVSIITGAAGGIGQANSRTFVQHGAKVIVADIQDKDGDALCRELNNQSDVATYVHCDVTSDSDVKSVVDLAVFKYGKLDIMFNNAGIMSSRADGIIETDNDECKKLFDVNVLGCARLFLGCQACCSGHDPSKERVYPLHGEYPHGNCLWGAAPVCCFKVCSAWISKEFVCGFGTLWDSSELHFAGCHPYSSA